MSNQCTIKPELHVPVTSLIASIREKHLANGGVITLSEIIALLGDISDADKTALQSRGQVTLVRTSNDGGTFFNTGIPQEIHQNGIRIKVPTELSGNYLSFDDNAALSFDSHHTLVGSFLFFSSKLEDIEANLHKLNINLSGETYDQCIIHDPA